MVAFSPPFTFREAEPLARAEDFARLAGQVFRRKRGHVGSWPWTRPQLEAMVEVPPGPAGRTIRLGLLKAWLGLPSSWAQWPWAWPFYVATIDAEPDANPPAVDPKIKLLLRLPQEVPL